MLTGAGRAMGLAWAVLPLLATAENKAAPGPSKGPPGAAVPAEMPAAFGFRGDGAGVFVKARPPTVWGGDSGKNTLWKTEVGRSQSSPVIGGNRVFVTAETELMLGLDRATGKVLWKKDNGFTSLPPEMKATEKRQPADPGCGYSTATPVTDGKHVWASYGTGIVVCHDRDGNRRWVRYLDRLQATQHGRSASPLLVGGKLLVSIGHLQALDPATGKTLWECPDATPSYGTPVAARIAGTEVVITPKGDCVRVADGKVLGPAWGETAYSSPVVSQGLLFIGTSARPLQLPHKADTRWESFDPAESFASPVVYDGIFYTVDSDSVLWAFEADTGKRCYEHELSNVRGMAGPPANFYASLVVAGGNLFVANDAGQTVVIPTGRAYKEIARNTLEEGSGATPVADGAQLFVRGGDMLYCLELK